MHIFVNYKSRNYRKVQASGKWHMGSWLSIDLFWLAGSAFEVSLHVIFRRCQVLRWKLIFYQSAYQISNDVQLPMRNLLI